MPSEKRDHFEDRSVDERIVRTPMNFKKNIGREGVDKFIWLRVGANSGSL